jgi:hypothetical protein
MDAEQTCKDAEIDKDEGLLRLISGAGRAEGDCPTAGGYR